MIIYLLKYLYYDILQILKIFFYKSLNTDPNFSKNNIGSIIPFYYFKYRTLIILNKFSNNFYENINIYVIFILNRQ